MGREEDERRVRRELHRMKRRKQERIRQLLTLGLLCISALIVAAAVLVLLRTLLLHWLLSTSDAAGGSPWLGLWWCPYL